ncbi:MAG: hypothetical protein QM752_07225 [Gammaproteobacteria bacterium]
MSHPGSSKSQSNKTKILGHAKYSMRVQAEKYIAAKANRGKSKASGAKLRSDRTVLRYQGDLGRAAEFIQKTYGIKKLKDITPEQAQSYIRERLAEKIGVRTVQGYAKALETLPLVSKLEVPSRSADPNDKPQNSRAYTSAQIIAIQQNLSKPVQLATQIILESGCRAQDFASLCLATERPIRNARLSKLHADRFAGREDWVQVNFIGKGGHEYTSTISSETAKALVYYRMDIPCDFRERKQENIVTKQYYNLPAGLQLSYLWSQASKSTLGFSRGLHGLRHTFAQWRVKEMQSLDMTWQKVLESVSQQMGHYRAEQISTYLR